MRSSWAASSCSTPCASSECSSTTFLYRASLSGSSSSRTASPAPTWSTASSTTWNAAARRVNAPDAVDVPDLVEKEMDYRVDGRTFTMLGGIHHFPPNPKKI